MEEKEMIRCMLSARYNLASLSKEELLNLASDEKEFDYFLAGLSSCMNYSFVFYAYRYMDVIIEMFKKNIHRMDENEKVADGITEVLLYLNEYDSKGYKFRDDFTPQYEFIVSEALGLRKFDVSLKDFDKNALIIWDKINEFKFDELKSDKYYLMTFAYLVYFHPEYVRNWEILPQIKESLNNFNKNDFKDKKEMKKYKSVVNKVMRNLEKHNKKKIKEFKQFNNH